MPDTSFSALVVSGLNFPSPRSRKYLLNLSIELGKRDDISTVIVAGNIFDGRFLEQELVARLRTVPPQSRFAEFERFAREQAQALNDFLPHIQDVRGRKVNYHIVLATKIYDRPIGERAMRFLIAKDGNGKPVYRNDIRLFATTEAKIPTLVPGLGDIRVLLPEKRPWFYDTITGLPQRLVNAFARKTFSDRPALILVGCAGVGAEIPEYLGVRVVAVPTLHKIDYQYSAETMVGCVVIQITKGMDDRFKIEPRFWDFGQTLSCERALAIPENVSALEERILRVLERSSVSPKVLCSRANEGRRRLLEVNDLKEPLNHLEKRELVKFDPDGNRYYIPDERLRETEYPAADFLAGSRTIRFVADSCEHIGALKALYFSMYHYGPLYLENADAWVTNGDLIQGVSHNAEYNGERLAGLRGPDQDEFVAAVFRAAIIMNVFARRWKNPDIARLPLAERIERSLIMNVYRYGNHDEPRYSHGKQAVTLFLFEEKFRSHLTKLLTTFLVDNVKDFDIHAVDLDAIVTAKVIRGGENAAEIVSGIPIAMKHPHQGGAKNRGTRIQQTLEFFVNAFADWPVIRMRKIAIGFVANFHTKCTIFMRHFGHAMIGVMTASQLFDTQFENNFNKVVQHGFTGVEIVLDDEGCLIGAKLSNLDDIHPKDAFVYQNEFTVQDVLKRTLEVLKLVDEPIPWR